MSNGVNGVTPGPNFFGGMTTQSIEAAGDYLDSLGLFYTPPEVSPDHDPFKPIKGQNYDPYKVGLSLDKDLDPNIPQGPAPQNNLTPFNTPGGFMPPIEAPSPTGSAQPPGNLNVRPDGVITTPGGYKIEATDRHEWVITAPDGKKTRIWGDPHVDEADGGKWDFKRDSTFVLADGTRIQVKTAPWGNGATVTDSLDIIAGNERVHVSGIRDGKGTPGPVTQDGLAVRERWGNKDVIRQGKDGDDWTHRGREIVGSENQGESFKLGRRQTMMGQEAREWVNFFRRLMPGMGSAFFDNLLRTIQGGTQTSPAIAYNPYNPTGGDANTHFGILNDSFTSVDRAFSVVGSYFDLQASVHGTRRTV